MSRKSRHRRTSCTVKKVHYDFLSAMQHCASLEKMNPTARLSIYKCDFCTGMHVTSGSSLNLNHIRKTLSTNLKLMRDPNWWVFCPFSIQSRRIDIEIAAIRQLHILLEPIYETTIP